MSSVNRSNSFDFARLFGALLVLYSHGYALAGEPEPTVAGFWSFGSFGVFLFFSISGYLITMSWLSDENVLRFAVRRSLRIFPALATVILLSAFVLGPIVTTLPMGQYFRHPETYRYLENIGLYAHYVLPGCFEHVPVANAVNGSLWSLPPEFLMYLILAVLGCTSLLRRRTFMLLFGCVVGASDLYLKRTAPLTIPLLGWTIPPHPAPVLFYGMELHQVMIVAPYFWAGCLCYLYRDRIAMTMNTSILVFMGMALLPPGDLLTVCSFLALPYLALAFCTQSDHPFPIPARIGDLSYGVYIYAFPIQQTVYYYLHGRFSALQMIGITLCATVICAFLSWHLIESPLLRLKPTRRLAKAT